MVKNEILAKLWDSKEVNDAISKMQPEELQYDLKAEIFLVLAEMDENKLLGLYERKELKFYIVRIMLNMIKSDRSTFYNHYRNFVEFDTFKYTEHEKINQTNAEHDFIDKLENNMVDMHWYNKEILRLYALEFKFNAKEISRQTGIPYISIIRTLNKTKTDLKKKLKK